MEIRKLMVLEVDGAAERGAWHRYTSDGNIVSRACLQYTHTTQAARITLEKQPSKHSGLRRSQLDMERQQPSAKAPYKRHKMQLLAACNAQVGRQPVSKLDSAPQFWAAF